MNLHLTKAIQKILLAGSSAAFAAGVLAAVGPQFVPPGPGMVPDYFGVVPNFANSPQPTLVTVQIAPPPAVVAPALPGGQATAAATTYDYTFNRQTPGVADVQVLNGGSGYSAANPPVVTFQSGNPSVVPATGTAIVKDGLINAITVNPLFMGAGYTQATTTVTITDTAPGTGTGAKAIALVAANGSISAIQVTNPGSGYTAPVVTINNSGKTGLVSAVIPKVGGAGYQVGDIVTITDPTGLNALAHVSAVDVAGAITAIIVDNPGWGYSAAPTISISPGVAHLGAAGAGASLAATINNTTPVVTPAQANATLINGVVTGITLSNSVTQLTGKYIGLTYAGDGYTVPLLGTGINKFVDALPGIPGVSSYITPGANGYDATGANVLGQSLPVAVPDTKTFPGSDYYEIEEGEHIEQLHSDLPSTHLRGYRQANLGTDAAGNNTVVPPAGYQYLGPIIVAQKDRPVRVRLINRLSTGAAGNLPMPVDTTYMGAEDTQNRTSLHLHGGNTPWISDGQPRQTVKPAGELVGANKGLSSRNVPDMWFDALGVLINNPACIQGTTTCTVPGATNEPGLGVQTFYYTNQQSQRLMFYHDHAEGTTRLNVYAGMAGGYLLQDPTEQAMINGGVANGVTYTAGTLPTLADTIPLVIQEKTFVPDDTRPVLNFYGPFRSQLNSQDPTWRWGSGVAAVAQNGTGDLWVPHIFMPNQNPGDVTGGNPMGRWDYGPWFWPPFVNITNGALANPYYDPNCISALATATTKGHYCEGAQMPGVPNGSLVGVFDAKTGVNTSSPSATPESFNDTPVVNGTAYPYINVDPKPYRLRILSAGNDRMLNLSLVMAASKYSADTTAAGNAGLANGTTLCDGSTAVNPADCTEVKMVPFDVTQNRAKPFPLHWYTLQKAGITFDGRPSGVFDPDTRGPAMVQIGNEGGFLASPAVILNQPINYEYNPKNIVIGNVKEHALLLGSAERADVLVDFTNFAGSTLILYNDAPAPNPAWDLRLDYYTGDFDATDTGGAFSTVPGYGPNSRTIMQIRVSTNGGTSTHPVDDTGTINMVDLTTAVNSAFKTSQEPIVVPQVAYNAAYGTTVADANGADLSRISDNSLTYKPLLDPLAGTLEALPVTINFAPKTIVEDWTRDWGRMNALLGTEIPRTTATVATALMMAYVDPPTELVAMTPDNGTATPISGTLPDGTQLWKITHNGVDAHPIHFHLFHVQLVNRVGWDGAVRTPDANEIGWKDTVRMNPLEDVIVALRPKTMSTPSFKVPNSHHVMDPSGNGMLFNLRPDTGNASNVTPLASNTLAANFGWEYIWHCHILGHEENDMMRPIAAAQAPETPVGLTATTTPAGVTLTWTDNSLIANWVTIQRDTVSSFTSASLKTDYKTVASLAVNPAALNASGECQLQSGCAMTYIDPNAPVAGTDYYYRVIANNTVGTGDVNNKLPATVVNSLIPIVTPASPGFTGFDNVTASSNPAVVARVTAPAASVMPLALTFPDIAVGATSPSQVVTVTNIGGGSLDVSSIVAPAGFKVDPLNPGTCGVPAAAALKSLLAGQSCTVNVSFAPTVAGLAAGNLTVNDNVCVGAAVAPCASAQTVALTGNTLTAQSTLSAALLDFGPQAIGTTTTKLVTLTNTGTGALAINSIGPVTGSAEFVLASTTCPINTVALPATLASAASCSITVNYAPTAAGVVAGSLVINSAANPAQAITLAGSTNVPVANVSLATLDFGGVTSGTTATQSVVVTNTGLAPLSFSSNPVVTGTGFSTGAGTTCRTTTPLAPSASCTIYVSFTPTLGSYLGNLAINDNSTGVAGTQIVVLKGSTPIPFANLPATGYFGNVAVGTNVIKTVTLTNTGTGPLAISSAVANNNAATPTAFSLVSGGTCGNGGGFSLAAGSSCTYNVRFTPPAGVVAGGSLVVYDNSNNIMTSSQTALLTGTGVVASVVVAPATTVAAPLTFANTARGATSAAIPVIISNTSSTLLNIASITTSSGNFGILSKTCGPTLAANSTCTVNVVFKPTAGSKAGAKTARLVITDNAGGVSGSVQNVYLAGTAL